MDARLKYIDRLLASFSAGDFDKRLRLANRLDEAEAVISGLHMLGEELKSIAISRNYFNDIFDAVSEMVFVVTGSGYIEELNEAACSGLGYTRRALVGRPLDVLAGDGGPSLFRQVRRRRGTDGLVRIWDRTFGTSDGRRLPVEITSRQLGRSGVLLTAQDITGRLSMEKRLLRAVIDGQEQERLRMARDLHDGLTQHLTAVKFLVGAAARDCGVSPLREKLEAANGSLAEILEMMRRICYNLMPRTLEDFGLVQALREVADQAGRAGMVRVVVEEGRGLPGLLRALEIDLFRVAQEFVSNGVRHGEATYIVIRLGVSGDGVEMRLKDNGRGFEPAMVQGQGMGLRNMYSRVKSHGGTFELTSCPGKGTEARIRVKINQSV
jgi:PAS domain S-box-containing protein